MIGMGLLIAPSGAVETHQDDPLLTFDADRGIKLAANGAFQPHEDGRVGGWITQAGGSMRLGTAPGWGLIVHGRTVDLWTMLPELLALAGEFVPFRNGPQDDEAAELRWGRMGVPDAG